MLRGSRLGRAEGRFGAVGLKLVVRLAGNAHVTGQRVPQSGTQVVPRIFAPWDSVLRAFIILGFVRSCENEGIAENL